MKFLLCLVYLLCFLLKLCCNGEPRFVSPCPAIHSCWRNWNKYLQEDIGRNIYACDCSYGCQNYGMCCADSVFTSSLKTPVENLSCMRMYNDRSHHEAFMVAYCADREHANVELCEGDPEIMNDPFLLVPVTSKKTGISYKNFYCAVCNEDLDKKDVTIWPMAVFRKVNDSTPFRQTNLTMLKYSKEDWHLNGVPVYAIARYPKKIESLVRICISRAVSSCAANWTDASISRKCARYLAYVYGKNGVMYKNPHCAMCNYENMTGLRCDFSVEGSIHPSPHYSFHSVLFVGLFSLDDDKIKCQNNEVYDSFAMKCRVKKCARKRYTLRGRRCVPKNRIPSK